MLSQVHIRNFKSIRDLEFRATRVNLFIGEPNTGKTNILESLALLSEGVHGPAEFREVFRFKSLADLFTDQQVTAPIEVISPQCQCSLVFKGLQFEFTASQPQQERQPPQTYLLDQTGKSSSWVNLQYGIKYYRFKPAGPINRPQLGSLTPPFGENLFSALYTDKALRRRVSDLFQTRNLRLEMRPSETELRVAKSIDDELYSFPYGSTSETWRRIVFFMAVLETNQDATLLLDEPEAHTFPFYTKYFAEQIALDNSNQFFITTHNPYLLSSVVEKTPAKDLSVFVTRMENFDTTMKPVPGKNLSELLELDADAFFNLDRLVNE